MRAHTLLEVARAHGLTDLARKSLLQKVGRPSTLGDVGSKAENCLDPDRWKSGSRPGKSLRLYHVAPSSRSIPFILARI